MSFFYDLNKRLATLAAKQDAKQVTESAKAEAVAQSPLTQALNESAVAEAGYSAKAGRAGKDLGKPGKNFAKIAKGAAERYGSKAAGERVAGAVLNKLRHPKESAEQGDTMDWLNDQLKDYDAQQQTKEGNAFTGALAKTPKGGKFKVGNKEFTDTSSLEEFLDTEVKVSGTQGTNKSSGSSGGAGVSGVSSTGGSSLGTGGSGTGGSSSAAADNTNLQTAKAGAAAGRGNKVSETGKAPMTPKQKAFAKLAPPKDKITFADKIAGAKKEVDEMLGDVAAEAIKSAIGKKKEPRSKGTAFDADFMKQQMAKKDAESHSRYDVHDTGYSKRYTRKAVDTDIDTDDEVKSDAPKKKGRPAGPKKGPERVTKGAWKHKGERKVKTEEDLDTDGVMMTRQTNCSSESAADDAAIKSAIKLLKKNGYNVDKKEEVDEKAVSKAQQKFMGMVHAAQKGEKPASKEVAKVAKEMPKKAAKDFASTKHKGLPAHVDEESTEKEDQKAERAGKKVAKDIEHDEGHKGKDDNRAEKAGKKVTKDIEYDDKKDKEEKVKESNKGGYNFGGSVYEGFNNKVENMIAEGMSVNISVDEQGKKSISVNATDEDAEALAQLLKMAGLGGQSGACKTCGESDCSCNQEMVDENQPDWPTNTETSNDALQYSGGLNKPKSTGQTTIPVIASQLRRQVSMEENVELERSLFKTWKNYKG
jgi:uncharacterized membrane protein YgcG